jgi:hypothetical protein
MARFDVETIAGIEHLLSLCTQDRSPTRVRTLGEPDGLSAVTVDTRPYVFAPDQLTQVVVEIHVAGKYV